MSSKNAPSHDDKKASGAGNPRGSGDGGRNRAARATGGPAPDLGSPVKKKRARQRHTATALTAAKRRAEALKLREQGLTFPEIADRLGLAVSTVFETVQVGFRELREQAAESAEQIVSIEITRLDKMLAALWPAIENGSTRAISTALKISERRMKILGLEREKLEMSGPGGGPIEVDSSAYERIKAKLAKYRENLAE